MQSPSPKDSRANKGVVWSRMKDKPVVLGSPAYINEIRTFILSKPKSGNKKEQQQE